MLCSSWMTCPWDLNRRKHNYTAFFPCLHGRPSCPGTLLLRWCTVKGGSPSDWSTTGDRANWNAAGAADRKEEEWSCGAFNSKLKHIESLNPQAVCSPLAVNSWRGRCREREGLNPLNAKGSWFMLLKCPKCCHYARFFSHGHSSKKKSGAFWLASTTSVLPMNYMDV